MRKKEWEKKKKVFLQKLGEKNLKMNIRNYNGRKVLYPTENEVYF
jgi:hypothetical protein